MLLQLHAKISKIPLCRKILLFVKLEKPNFGFISDPFSPKTLKMRCLAKNLVPSLFKLDDTLTSCKKLQNSYEQFGENPLANGQMVKQTN